ncbi:RNA polymerase sigma factor [Moorella sp. Hama-1]|uniref:RNA polymerase sigma factor n=1 Tax=Moorella sp. Hama-1 TaxID=2138101 RepID=UPI000D659805|nr:RNA polymerase sigma factor [Moorella sp. Hama-1]BCV21026.1 DNA-directed RNA polymerase sigma-70 factor [Moorella sp. Hama-1]
MDDLIQRCQQGDVEAFSILVERNGAKAVRTAYLITGRRDMAEDIAQETFIQCYRDIKRLRKPEMFQAWFYRVLSRLSWRHTAKEKGKVSLESLADSDNKFLVNDTNLAEAVEAKLKKDIVQKAVGRLNTPLRTTIVLYYFNELSIKEIAHVLGCREGTVKSRLHNARKQLARELKQYGLEPSSRDERAYLGQEDVVQ